MICNDQKVNIIMVQQHYRNLNGKETSKTLNPKNTKKFTKQKKDKKLN